MSQACDGALSMSLPYNERAALAVLETATANGRIGRVVRMSPGPQRSRRSDTPPLATPISLARRAMDKVSNPRGRLLNMHLAKVAFDHVAARSFSRTPPTAIFAFPGAARATFQTVGDDAAKVLHSVDAHPEHHNARLRDVYGREARSEEYPQWLVARIEAELSSSDQILVPSNVVMKQMLRQGIAQQRLLLNPYGVDFDLFNTRPIQVDTARRPRFIYVGQISRRKGLPFLLEAARVGKFDLTLVGTQFLPDSLENVPENVRVMAPMPHHELVEEYNSHDTFILPTIEDACSLVALEAVASGLRVATTSYNGALEILPASSAITIPAADSDAIVQLAASTEPLSYEDRLRIAHDARTEGTIRDWRAYGEETLRCSTGSNDIF